MAENIHVEILLEDNPDDIELALSAFQCNNLTHHMGVNSDSVEPIDFQQFSAAIQTWDMGWLLLNELPTA